jgi:short-subunit dehydrogenase
MTFYTGCTALITGATAGIGGEFARQLAPYADTLILVARRGERLAALEQELLRENKQLTIHSRTVDLSDEAQIDGLAQWVKESGFMLDLLVNNAGLGDHGDFSSADWAKLKRIISVNITALTKLTYLLLPVLRHARPSAIINVSSIAGFLPLPNTAVYAASKSYVTSLSEGLRAELRGSGVRVTTVCPGPVDTEFGDVAERGDGAVRVAAPSVLKIPASQVAYEGLIAASHDRARIVPGFLTAVGTIVLCLVPMFVLRLVLNRMVRQED